MSDGDEEDDNDVERAFPAQTSSNNNMDETIWLGDTGASAHMTMPLIGMYELQDFDGTVTVGNGEKMKVVKVGTKKDTVLQADGTKKNIVLKKVKYVPALDCNLLSLTQAIEAGFEMTDNKSGMKIKKGRVTYEFDRRFKSGSGVLLGMKMVHQDVGTNVNSSARNKIDAHVIHAKLGHPGEEFVRATCKNLNLTLRGPMPKCSSCAISKMRQKNTRKTT